MLKLRLDDQNRILVSVILIYLFLGTVVLLHTPYNEFPDEDGHFRYVRYVADNWGLPVVSSSRKELTIPEAAQPPLYYFLSAILLTGPFELTTSLYLVRLFTLLLAALTLVLIFQTSLVVFPGNRNIAFLSVAATAFNAQFIFTNAGVTNNSLAALLCSITIYLCAGMFTRSVPVWQLGLSFGLALLTRQMSAFLFPVCLIAITLRWRRSKRPYSLLFLNVSIFCLISFLVAGWYYIRNWIYFGDPNLYKVAQALDPGFIRQDPISWFYLVKIWVFMHPSFWAYFGLHKYHAGIPEYSVYLLLEALAAVGVYELISSRQTDVEFEPTGYNRAGFFLILVSLVIALFQFVVLSLKLEAMQGRYLYVAIAPISILLGSGLVKILPIRRRKEGTIVISGMMLCLCLYLLLFYWLPHYP